MANAEMCLIIPYDVIPVKKKSGFIEGRVKRIKVKLWSDDLFTVFRTGQLLLSWAVRLTNADTFTPTGKTNSCCSRQRSLGRHTAGKLLLFTLARRKSLDLKSTHSAHSLSHMRSEATTQLFQPANDPEQRNLGQTTPNNAPLWRGVTINHVLNCCKLESSRETKGLCKTTLSA